MRIYDPRVGRFLSVDPLTGKYPELTPYQYASNTPIHSIDIDGLESGDPPYLKNNVNFVQLHSPWVGPLIRPDKESFTTAAIKKNTADKVEYTINAQMFKGSYFSAVFGPTPKLDHPGEGLTISGGRVVFGQSSPGRSYVSVKNNVTSFGEGDPPSNSDFAVGGGIPLILNGLKYGPVNQYAPDAPSGLPATGDPGEANRKYLIQRSSAGYAAQEARDQNAQLGKSILAFSSKNNSVMLVTQQDGIKGLTLTQIRDYLVGLGYNNALSFDGSSSATLVKDNKVMASPADYKDNSIPSGIIFTIKK